MQNNLSTAINVGAKIPFLFVMQLSRREREIFIKTVTPGMDEAQKRCCLKFNAH